MKRISKNVELLVSWVILAWLPGSVFGQSIYLQATSIPDPNMSLEANPLLGEDSELLFTGDETYPGPWMIQTTRSSVDEDFLAKITVAGAQPLPIYVPDRNVLANIPDSTVLGTLWALQDTQGMPLVQALNPYHPLYKIDPHIGSIPLTDSDRLFDRVGRVVCEVVTCSDPSPGGLMEIQQCEDCQRSDPVFHLAIELFPGSNVVAVELAVAQTGALLLQTLPSGDEFRLHVIASELQYQRIAFIPSVAWMEEIPELILHNNTATWTVQSGTLNSKPLWEKGLHGEGQIVGHIDDPIDFVSKFFACDSIADPACDNAPGPAHRKMAGYDDNPIWQFTSELFNFTSQLFEVLPCAPDCSATDFRFADPLGNIRVLDPRAWSHGTHTAGIIAGDRSPFIGGLTNGNGHAYQARLFHTDLEQLAAIGGRDFIDPYGSDPVRITLYEALQHAYDVGARVFSNSWGVNFDSVTGHGPYSYWSKDADKFAYDHEDALIIFSGSNFNFTTSPENAKNVLTVGPSHNGANAHLLYKNQDGIPHAGPTFDGRRKPEIFAPGADEDGIEGGYEGIVSAQSNPGDANLGTTKWDGSSMAAAAIAGGAALARQYFTEGWYPSGTPDLQSAMYTSPSGALLKAVLLNSTVNMEGPEYPSNAEGWGLLRLDEALYFPGDSRNLLVLEDKDKATGLSTGETFTCQLDIPVGSTEPLKITLTFSEPPALPAVTQATINNLDLLVTDPSGNTYKGNLFDTAAGVSLPNRSESHDLKNNVEMVLVAQPAAGTWTIEVLGTEINLGKQGFALVATGHGISQYTQPNDFVPMAIENSYTASYEQDLDTLSLGLPSLLANDADGDGDSLTALLTGVPSCGSVDLNSDDGHFVFHAQGCPLGPVTFTYQAFDGIDHSPDTTVTLEVVNHTPVALGDYYKALINDGLDTLGSGLLPLLTNDHDRDGNSLTAVLASPPSCGSLDLSPADGHFIYYAETCPEGLVTFTYSVSDGVTSSSPATVTISVGWSPDTGPIEDFYVLSHDRTLDTAALGLPSVLDNDLTDSMPNPFAEFGVVPQELPPCGTLEQGSPDGHFVFNAQGCPLGPVSFPYRLTYIDVFPFTIWGNLTIEILNDPPFVANDHYAYVPDQILDTANLTLPSLVANDSDGDGDALDVLLTVPPACGNVVVDPANGHFRFDPVGCGSGEATSFEYQISDSLGALDTGLVSLIESNIPPAAAASSIPPEETTDTKTNNKGGKKTLVAPKIK